MANGHIALLTAAFGLVLGVAAWMAYRRYGQRGAHVTFAIFALLPLIGVAYAGYDRWKTRQAYRALEERHRQLCDQRTAPAIPAGLNREGPIGAAVEHPLKTRHELSFLRACREADCLTTPPEVVYKNLRGGWQKNNHCPMGEAGCAVPAPKYWVDMDIRELDTQPIEAFVKDRLTLTQYTLDINETASGRSIVRRFDYVLSGARQPTRSCEQAFEQHFEYQYGKVVRQFVRSVLP